MLTWFYKLLYGSSPARFESDYELDESIARLKSATVRSVFQVIRKQSAVGPVSEDRVSLQRVIPFVGNSFKPIFAGRFVVERGRVVLTGHFTYFVLSKIFMTIWFGFMIMWTGIATFSVIAYPQAKTWFFPFAGIGMFCLGIVIVQFGRWLSRNDRAWLSGVISGALARVPPNHSLKLDGPDGPPT